MYINESHAQKNITAGRVVVLSTICVAFLVFYSWALLRGLIQPLLLANLLSRCLRLLRHCTAASSGRSSLTRLIYNAIGLHFLRLRCHLSLFPVVQMPFVSIPAFRDLSATSNFLNHCFPLQNLYSVCIALIVWDILTNILFVALSACCPPCVSPWHVLNSRVFLPLSLRKRWRRRRAKRGSPRRISSPLAASRLTPTRRER